MSASSAQPASAGSNADSNPYQFITLSQSPRQRANRNYNLKLRQQPKHSRMCGFGEKVDRRPLDPPPIIQLEIQNTSFTDENSYLYNPYYFMYASLISPESEEELHLLRDGKTRSTTGSIVSSLYRLKDLDNKDGAFFVFPDLSVRMEGTYRLKFSLFEIINTEIYHCSSICSDVFNVYPAKKFPGMEESTFLSRTFAEQGLKIRIRKELRMRKGRGKKGANDEYDSGDNANKKRSRKKSRRGSADRSDKDSESGYSDEGRSDAAQKRRTGAKASTDAGDKSGANQQMYPGYDRGYDPNRPMGPMGHHDPRHYHMPHDASHPYPHPYGPMSGMPPKVWHGHGDPYQSSMPPHGYPPLPHYDPNVPYPQGPPGHHGAPDQDGAYPSVYNPGQRPVYPPPPHMYNSREHDGQMMEWHHRDYRHHGYGAGPGPATGPYVGSSHGYEDPSPRAAAPASAQPPGEHAAGPAAGANVPYYGHHPSVPGAAVRPSPTAHGGEHGSSHAHGMEKPYPGPPIPHYGAPPGYYGGPYPGNQGQVPPGMPYPYQGVPVPGMIPPAGGDVLGAPVQTPVRDPQRGPKPVNPEDASAYLAGQQQQQQATPNNNRIVGGTLQSNVGQTLPLGVQPQPVQPSGVTAGQVSPPPHSHPGGPVTSTTRSSDWM